MFFRDATHSGVTSLFWMKNVMLLRSRGLLSNEPKYSFRVNAFPVVILGMPAGMIKSLFLARIVVFAETSLNALRWDSVQYTFDSLSAGFSSSKMMTSPLLKSMFLEIR